MMKKIPGWVKITGLVLVVCVIVIAGGIFALYSLWMKDSREVVENLAQYEEILGQNGRYKKNYVEYNDIFPDQLPESADVETFYYEYYNPWDANYLGYLVYTCDEDDFRTEYDRLHKIKSSALPLIYGATGFPLSLIHILRIFNMPGYCLMKHVCGRLINRCIQKILIIAFNRKENYGRDIWSCIEDKLYLGFIFCIRAASSTVGS